MRFDRVVVRACVASIVAALVLAGAPAIAQEATRNAIGFYAAPTTHHVAPANEAEELESSTLLDFGAYYTRFLPRDLALRVEFGLAEREFGAWAPAPLFPGGYFFYPTREVFLEVPVLLHANTTVSVGDATVRIFVGGGAYYAVLVAQDFLRDPSPVPDTPQEPLDAGGYGRYGWVGDGGAALVFRPRRAVFLGFRFQDDFGMSGAPDISIAREGRAFGFYAGFEWLF